MITIIDYGAGNVASVAKAFLHLGKRCEVVRTAEAIGNAERLVLPGVGHFAGIERLGEMRTAIMSAIAAGVPFFGICVGMQWLFAGSEEAEGVSGLGIFPQRCERFAIPEKVPHVGWNNLQSSRPSSLLHGIEQGSHVYYTHSFFCPVGEEAVATSTYGIRFAAAAERENVYATQFHPEKSGAIGLRVLKNFAETVPC